MAQTDPTEIFQRALELPADDRLALATELIESVEGPEDPEWAAAWAVEIDRRVKEIDSSAVKGIPWEQVRAEMFERFKAK